MLQSQNSQSCQQVNARGISQMKYVSRLIQALDHVTALMSDAAAKAYTLSKEYDSNAARKYLIRSRLLEGRLLRHPSVWFIDISDTESRQRCATQQ